MHFVTAAIATTLAATPPSPPQEPLLYELPYHTDRTVVGDWEPPHSLVLVATSLWPETMTTFLDRALEHVDVVLLADETVSSEPDALFEGPFHRTSLWTSPMPNTPWIRDYGPLQTRTGTGEVIWIDAHYTDERRGDDDVPRSLGERLGVEVEALDLPLDGGALASNGDGWCVSTMEFFVDYGIDFEPDALNPWMEQVGCQWLLLVNALAYDDTRHVDMFLQFTDVDAVAVARVADHDGIDAKILDDVVAQLRATAREIDVDLRIDRVDMPVGRRGRRYFSYLNMLPLEHVVLTPSYTSVDEAKQQAIYTQLTAATGKGIVTVPVRQMIELSGALHCAAIGLVE